MQDHPKATCHAFRQGDDPIDFPAYVDVCPEVWNIFVAWSMAMHGLAASVCSSLVHPNVVAARRLDNIKQPYDQIIFPYSQSLRRTANWMRVSSGFLLCAFNSIMN